MALAMRTVGGGCRAMAAARVVCGMELTTRMARLSQSEFPRRDGAVQRCQAATMMVEARETGGAAVMDESSSLASFEASYRSSEWDGAAAAAARVYHGRRGGGDWYPEATPVRQEATDLVPMMGKGEVIASLEASLHEAGRNAGTIASLAVRAWRNLGDADRAEELYLMALELAPQDSSIQASYAEFLWQCDA